MPEDLVLRFVHISDTHLSHDPNYTYDPKTYPLALPGARALVEQVNALPFTPDFVLHTGDVAYDPDSAAYAAARAVLGQIKYPVHYLVGNHDDGDALQRTLVGHEPRTPFCYEFAARGAQIICLDTQSAVAQKGITPPAGWIDDAQLVWLESLLLARDERPLVVALHHNPLKVGIPWFDEYMGLQNGDALHSVLLKARPRLRGVFFGHIHQNIDIYRDGILYSSALSSWYQLHCWPGQTSTVVDSGAEPGFSVVTVTREQTLIRRHRFSL
ncbi:MAG: metallophosphoesterase [Chloroflexi bacterium]|nr:metallophosphoesterase [Chloroflexota bacterium]